MGFSSNVILLPSIFGKDSHTIRPSPTIYFQKIALGNPLWVAPTLKG